MLGSEMPLPVVYKQDGCPMEKRDPCASPPCKRLKQASIPFQIIIDDNKALEEENILAKQITGKHEVEDEEGSLDNGRSNNCGKTSPMETEVNQNSTTTLPTDACKTNEQLVKNITPVKDSVIHHEDKVKKSPLKSPTSGITKDGILKYTQPVTPGDSTTTPPAVDKVIEISTPKYTQSITPGDSITTSPAVDKAIEISTPVNHVASSTVLTTPKQDGSCTPILTPRDKTQTVKSRTPGRKLSVEEKLRREEEKLRKQKEKEQQEQERLEKKKEKERLKMEKEKERQDEKEKREQEKLEQQALKKQREKERQEKKDKEEKEKQEKIEKKEEERKKRDEEKKRKEDEKNSKIEEKRKKEEEENLKKQRVKNSFASFFLKKEIPSALKQKEQVETEVKFQPFELKPFMKLASTKPIKPLTQCARETLDKTIVKQGTTSLCLVKEELQIIKQEVTKEKQIVDLTTTNVNKDQYEDDIMIIDEVSDKKESTEKLAKGIKPKLLQFHDNYRPAYFGTWRKKSSSVGPRGPFKKDTDLINYDVDSDEEWEEEEPGESLSNSEGEDEEKDDEKEENDGFFVPHGYLSDDEGAEEGKDEDTEEMEVVNSKNNTSTQYKTDDKMERQLAKQKAWETEMKRQFKPMKPVVIGCIWSGEIPSLLQQLEACCLVSGSIDPIVKKQELDRITDSPCSTTGTTTYNNTAMPVPDEAMPSLVKFVHGNTDGLNKIIKLFRKRWTLENKNDEGKISESNWQEHCMISKRQLERVISKIAKKEKRPILPKARWYVHDTVLAKYKMEDISLSSCDGNNEMIETSPLSNKVRSLTPTIKQFTQIAMDQSSGEQSTTKTEFEEKIVESVKDTSAI